MDPTNSRFARGPARTQASYRARSQSPWPELRPEPRRDRRSRRGRPGGVTLALLVTLACLTGLGAAELATSHSGPEASRSRASSPAGTAAPRAGAATPAKERLGTVSWPVNGASAADISGIGVTDGPDATEPAPIASVAKLMTAYVILQDHPLSSGESGPDITVEPSEADAYSSQVQDGDSLVAVSAGETISERQALEALLLPSADNMAWILARWDAGGQDAFTARMNTVARNLGMTGTSYTDASGLDSSTTSTAADQVRLGMAAMRVPALASITAMSTADVPVAGTVHNTNTLLGQDGIAGLKTGNTQAAGGCVLLAAWSQVNGQATLIVAAAFGQPGTGPDAVANALQAGRGLVLSLDQALGPDGQSAAGGDSADSPRGPGQTGRGQHGPPALG